MGDEVREPGAQDPGILWKPATAAWNGKGWWNLRWPCDGHLRDVQGKSENYSHESGVGSQAET